jgi:hypothetical protein
MDFRSALPALRFIVRVLLMGHEQARIDKKAYFLLHLIFTALYLGP